MLVFVIVIYLIIVSGNYIILVIVMFIYIIIYISIDKRVITDNPIYNVRALSGTQCKIITL